MPFWMILWWSSHKKQWYRRGKLLRKNYNTNIPLKEFDKFIQENVQNEMKKQIELTQQSINEYNDRILELDNEKNSLIEKENEEISNIDSYFADETKKIEDKKLIYSSTNIKEISSVNDLVKKMSDWLVQYSEKAYEEIQNQTSKLIEFSVDLSKKLMKIGSSDAQQNYKDLTENSFNQLKKNNLNNDDLTFSAEKWKHLAYLWAFVFFCFYDAVITYSIFKETFDLGKGAIFLLSSGLVLFIVISFHFCWQAINDTKKDSAEKNLWIFWVIIIVAWLLLLIKQSIPQWLAATLNDPSALWELIFRVFIVWSVIAWEFLLTKIDKHYIIDQIGNIIKYLYIPFKHIKFSIGKFLTHLWIFREQTKYLSAQKEIIKSIESIDESLGKHLSVKQLIDDVFKINDMLLPILEQHELKITEYENQIQSLTNEMNAKKNEVRNMYKDKIASILRQRQILLTKIDLVKKQLGQMEHEVTEWLKIWLS